MELVNLGLPVNISMALFLGYIAHNSRGGVPGWSRSPSAGKRCRDRGWRREDGAHRPSGILPGAIQRMGAPSARAQGRTWGRHCGPVPISKGTSHQPTDHMHFHVDDGIALGGPGLACCYHGSSSCWLQESRSDKQPWGHMNLHRCGRSSCPGPQQGFCLKHYDGFNWGSSTLCPSVSLAASEKILEAHISEEATEKRV